MAQDLFLHFFILISFFKSNFCIFLSLTNMLLNVQMSQTLLLQLLRFAPFLKIVPASVISGAYRGSVKRIYVISYLFCLIGGSLLDRAVDDELQTQGEGMW